MKIAITGGSGFIGTNLIQFYIDRNISVINIDKASPKNNGHKDYWRSCDMLNREQLKNVLLEFLPTHIIHLAARADLKGKSLTDYEINTLGTQNLLEVLKILPHVQKVIFASTMLVCSPGYIPATDNDYCPATVYGESKMNMEIMLRKEDLVYDWIIIRPTSIWGPWFAAPYKDFFDKVYAKSYFNIKDKACTKTYGFVLNSVFQINELLMAPTNNGTIFYIGDQPPLNIAEWANQIAKQLGYKKFPEVPYSIFSIVAKMGDVFTKIGLPFPVTSFRLKNMTTDNVLPLESLYNITGPAPYDMDSAISITLKWLKNNH